MRSAAMTLARAFATLLAPIELASVDPAVSAIPAMVIGSQMLASYPLTATRPALENRPVL